MRLHLRLDHVTPVHIIQTVFVDGANCGTLTLDVGQYQTFGAALLLGAAQMRGHLIVEIDPISHDAEGNFAMPKPNDTVV